MVITDLEDAVLFDAGRGTPAPTNDILLRRVSNGERIRLVLRHRHAILIIDRVLMPVNSRIDAQREHVLVERGHDARPDIRAPGHRLPVFVVEGDGGEDAGCTDLELDVSCLVEDEREYVFVVRYCADHLHDQLPVPHDGGGAGAVVCVLVLEAVVLLVHADDVLELDRCPLGVGAVAIEVLDVAETVAAEGELVGCDAESDVADIKCLLAMVRSAGV